MHFNYAARPDTAWVFSGIQHEDGTGVEGRLNPATIFCKTDKVLKWCMTEDIVPTKMSIQQVADY